MTITLEPETEAKLRQTAQREGRDVDAVVNALLVEGLQQRERELGAGVAAIQAGLDDVRAGREKPLEQYIAEQRVKRGLPETWPAASKAVEVSPGVFEAGG